MMASETPNELDVATFDVTHFLKSPLSFFHQFFMPASVTGRRMPIRAMLVDLVASHLSKARP
jgi:hypothetical protein